MKKFLFSATTAAVLAAMSSGASAVVNLDTGAGSVNYANQLVVAGTTALTGAGANVTSTLGFGVSNLQTRFIRYDLTNAVFKTQVAAGDLVVSAPGATVTVAQGGQANSAFVIFQITANGDIDQAATVNFASGSGASSGLVIQNAASAVQMAYSLYSDAPSAQAGGAAGRLNSNFAAQTVAGLVSGLALTTVQNTTTVEVAGAVPYTRFSGGFSATAAQIGTVTADAAVGVLNPTTGNQVTYAQLVATGTALVLKGDFSAAVTPSTASAGVFLGTGNCNTAGIAPTPATPVSGAANFVTGATPQVNVPVCFSVPANNTTPIPTQDFTIELDVTAAAGSTATDLAPIAAGKFLRNGTVLKHAFADTTTASGVTMAVHMTNTGSIPAPYTVRCLMNNGSAAGTPGTVPPNTAVRQSVGNGLGCTTNGTLRGIELTFAVPDNVMGAVVRQNTSTGTAGFDTMLGSK